MQLLRHTPTFVLAAALALGALGVASADAGPKPKQRHKEVRRTPVHAAPQVGHGHRHAPRKRVYRGRRPAPHYVRVAPVYRPAVRPWYVGAPRVVSAGSSFVFHAGLNVYLGGGVNLGLSFGNVAPAGYVYADPVCDLQFATVSAYQDHLYYVPHRPLLTARPIPVCAYGP